MSTTLAIRNEKQYLANVSQVRALAERCEHITDAKDLADKARACEVWAQRAHLGIEKVNLAAAARLWAERRAGELLAETVVPRGNHWIPGKGSEKSLPENVTKKESFLWQKLAAIDADTFAAEVEAMVPKGRITYAEIERRAKRLERENASAEAEAALVAKVRTNGGPTWRIEHMDLREFDPGPVDAIVTDPPYITDDSIDLYRALGEFAARVLRPGGALFAMASQPYLPSVFRALEHPELVYRWTVAWISGAYESTADQRRVFDRWKPVLVYHRGNWPSKVRMLTDVVNSGRDEEKQIHPWQQTLIGTRQLVRSACHAGAVVCDPFLGGGTTALAALAENRHFVGCDIEAEAVTATERRLAA